MTDSQAAINMDYVFRVFRKLREELPKLAAPTYKDHADVALLNYVERIEADLSESRRLLDEANVDRDRLYKALEYVVRDLNTRANMKLRKEDRGVVDIGNGAWFQANDALEKHNAAPVPAQPALTTVEFDSAYNLGWHECEEKMAYESTQPATVPEAVAKDVSALDAAGQFNRKVAYAWFPLRISKKRQLISDYGITIPQGPTESDSQWAMRALHAMLERPECRAALLSAADTEVKNG